MTEDYSDPYSLPANDGHPADIAARLMLLPEHAPLLEHEVAFGWLMRNTPKIKGGKVELGSVHAVKTMAQGGFKDLFTMMLGRLLGTVPDYVIVINAEWWAAASAREKDALIFHELSHVKQAVDDFGALRFDKDGFPVWALVGHDVEAFNAEVARFGAWHEGIASFLGHAGS
jgi:hypothetical protein